MENMNGVRFEPVYRYVYINLSDLMKVNKCSFTWFGLQIGCICHMFESGSLGFSRGYEHNLATSFYMF